MADVCMGYLFTHASLELPLDFFWLLLASSCIYSAGMVLNDVFDYAVDLRERPGRPLPSGRIRRRTAVGLAVGLVAIGLAAAAGASIYSFVVAAVLVACVLLYDGWLKATPAGPFNQPS